MPRSPIWRHRVSKILAAVRMLECAELERAQIESLFGLRRRAALRLMAPFVSGNRNGSWQVDRPRLIVWLERIELEVQREQDRYQRVVEVLTDVEAENRGLRQEFRREGRPDPPSWTLKQEVFSRSIKALPREISIAPGNISVHFPQEDPVLGVRLLHELSLAMVSDWTTFCRLASLELQTDPKGAIDTLLVDLEWQRLRGIDKEE